MGNRIALNSLFFFIHNRETPQIQQNSDTSTGFRMPRKMKLGEKESFSNSTKLRYIYWIQNAKKDETRRKRIIDVVKKATQEN